MENTNISAFLGSVIQKIVCNTCNNFWKNYYSIYAIEEEKVK